MKKSGWLDVALTGKGSTISFAVVTAYVFQQFSSFTLNVFTKH